MKALIATLALVTPLSFAQAEQATKATTTGPQASASGTTAEAEAKASTVEGPIAKVVAKKKEIYVQGADKKYEFYFKPETTLTKDGVPVDFATLTEGTKVRVTYTKVGKRTDPVKVEIIQ